MALYSGRNAWIGLGVESTYGTPVSRTNYLKVDSITAEINVVAQDRDYLYHGVGGVALDDAVSSKEFGLTIEGDLSYDGLGMLLRACTGVATDGAGPPYAHSYTLGDAEASLTIEATYGDDVQGGTPQSDVFEGCKVTRLRIFATQGSPYVKYEATIIAEDKATRGNAGTPTFTSPNPVLMSQGSTLAWNSLTKCMRSFELTLDRGLTRRNCVGSELTKETWRGALASVELSASIEVDDNGLVDGYLARAASDAVITFTGLGNEAGILEIHNAKISADAMPVSSHDINLEAVTFKGFSDGTDLGLLVQLTNDTASGTAN